MAAGARPAQSGSYCYLLNGEAAAIDERWQRHRLSPGAWRVTGSRRAGGIEIAVSALEAGGIVSRFEVAWRAGAGGLWAAYTLLGDRVAVSRRSGTGPARSESIPFPPDTGAPLLSPLLRVFTGPLIARLLERGGNGLVVLPSIADPADSGTLLRPLASERRARLVQDDAELSIAGVPTPCRRCEYLGDQYGPGTQFWLGPDDTLLRYQWRQSPDQLWDVWLEPDPAEHDCK